MSTWAIEPTPGLGASPLSSHAAQALTAGEPTVGATGAESSAVGGASFASILVTAAAAPGAAAPAAAGSAWGEPVDLSSPAADTYALARQWFYALRDPGAAPAGSVFSQAADPGPGVAAWLSGAPAGDTPSYGAFQLRQLLEQFNAQGARYWPTAVYPAIPDEVFAAAGWGGARDTRAAQEGAA